MDGTDYSSTTSSSDLDDSSSSSDSDDFEPKPPAKAPRTAKFSGKRINPSASRTKVAASMGGTSASDSSALKVKLKLPPGFNAKQAEAAVKPAPVADRGKLKVQVTNSRPPAKKQKTAANGAARKKKATTPKGKAVKKVTTNGSSKRGAQPVGDAAQLLAPPPPDAPPVQPILPNLIPSGPTVPSGEIRGKRELKLVGSNYYDSRPDEVAEEALSAEFNDPFAVESDALRNLDLFFFCDEDGNTIGLEILEKPKHERPRIMGFGTVVQHLPPAERPIPVKYILPSPAFPSRSRKRPRSDSATGDSSPSKPARSRSSPSKKSTPKSSKKRASSGLANGSHTNEKIQQLDGSNEDATAVPSSRSTVNIFATQAYFAYSSSRSAIPSISQLDGHSESGESSDDSHPSGGALSNSDSDGEKSGSDSDSDSSDSGSDVERDAQNATSKHQPAAMDTDSEPSAESSPSLQANGHGPPLGGLPCDNATPKSKKSSTPKLSKVHPDVDELMRTDREGKVQPRGTEDQLNLLECGFRHPSEYKRARVWLPEITDWCLDYSEGDPTLWVITPHSWYKIAGPLSGMLPHESYREKFQHVRKMFEASYLVAYVLKEWLPINKKVSYRSTLQQIVELSLRGRYPVSAWFLMENYHFIQNQICDLVADKDAYLDSMFFKQLQRMHEGHRAREERVRKEMADREEKRTRREDERLKKRQQLEEERKKLQDRKDEERKQKEAERRYPMDDLELLAEEGGSAANQLPITESKWHGLDGFSLGDIIVSWQTISTFKDFVNLEPIPLDQLATCIKESDKSKTDSSLVRIFMAFLKVILSEKSFVAPMDDLVVEGSTTVADLFVNTERTYGICERPYLELLNAVTWQDILRQLMAKDLGIDASIGKNEPLIGCEIVRQTLYMQNNSVPFNAPVDVTIKGLEDYAVVIKNPMDLGTIKSKLDKGEYEADSGHDLFAADVQLVWDNAIAYNTEESEVGRAAVALSDIFEQDYQRLVAGRITANRAMLQASETIGSRLRSSSTSAANRRPDSVDVVHALYAAEFHELPVSFKIASLSWLCNEFLKLDSIRSHLEAQAETEFEANRECRRKAGEIDARKKLSEKNRREREQAFRSECIEQGIEPNANNHFSDAVKQEHEFIANFYDELHAEKAAEDVEWQSDRKALEDETRATLDGVIVRESPVGRDRYHNSYWLFKHDTKKRLFVEKSDSGEFVAMSKREDIEALLSWLNPKGVRELDLLGKINKIKDDLLSDDETNADEKTVAFWTGEQTLTVSLFPLPGDATKSVDLLVLSSDTPTRTIDVLKKMLLRMLEYLQTSKILPADWEASVGWKSRVSSTASVGDLAVLFTELEAVVVSSRGGEDTVRVSWKRKRRELRLSLEGCRTASQVVFLLHLFLAECINVEAFMDLSGQLERKDWVKLRSKDARNFVPEVGKHVLYFGDGHAQALKEDAKAKKKRFTRKSDSPLLHKTLLCQVGDVSFYNGGGDPYALLVLRPDAELKDHVTTRPPGSFLCPQPSPQQRLSRVFVRIVSKLMLHADAGPFLEPVSDRDFPMYKEIVLHPRDLSTIRINARAHQYASADQFMKDLRLVASNCELFCEGRFPALPPLARSLVEMGEAQLKKAQKELRVCEKAIAEGADQAGAEADAANGSQAGKESATVTKDDIPNELVVILRLENRLQEYIVDVKRYEAAVSRTWRYGEKFRMLFRDPQGHPGEYYGGVAAGSLPFNSSGLMPWEALRVVWDEDDGSDDSRINPWEAEIVPEGRKGR